MGVGLRIAYVDHTSPNPDEQVAQAVVKNLSFPDKWDTNWAKTDVTEYFRHDQYNFSSYHYLLYLWKSLFSPLGIDWISAPWVMRILNGLFGVIFIGALALAVRQLVGEIASIASASAGAVIPLFIQDAHYIRCEAMLTAGVTLLLLLATRPESRNRSILFSTGLIAGWMVACKATMGLAVPLLLPLLLSASKTKPISWEVVRGRSLLVGLGFVAGIVAGVPWGVAQPHLYFSGLARLAMEYRSPMPPYTSPDMAPSFQTALAYMNGTLGWGFWAVTGVGLGRMLKQPERWRTVLIGVPLLASFVIFGSHSFFAERSYSPFLPIAMVYFGAGCKFIVDNISRYRPILHSYRTVVLVLFLSITLALPAIYSWQIVFKGFSGHEQLNKVKTLSRMKGNLSGKTIVIIGSLFGTRDCLEIEKVIASKIPALVVVCDECDPLTPSCLKTLQDRYDGRILGVHESLFPNLPPCTLQTFISPRMWLLYIPAKE